MLQRYNKNISIDKKYQGADQTFCTFLWDPHFISSECFESFVMEDIFSILNSDRMEEMMYIIGVKPRTQKLIKCISFSSCNKW